MTATAAPKLTSRWLARGQAGMLNVGFPLILDRMRDPYRFEIVRNEREWQNNDGLRRAIAKLAPTDRSMLRLWMSRYATQGGRTVLHARTVREAIAEIRALARADARLSAAIELYAAPRSMGLAAPPENKMLRVVR